MKTIRCNENFLSRYNYLKKSGKDFKILDYFEIINTSVFKNLNLPITQEKE